jgi:hypothetical protein
MLGGSNNLPQMKTILDSAENSAEEEVRSLKDRSLLVFLSSPQQGFQKK